MIEISTEKADGAVILNISGDVDLYSSPEVRKVLLALTQKKTHGILINLQSCNYMDSSGVATLVEGLQQVGKYKGKLVLFGLDAAVKEVFELSRLDKVFEICASQDDALEKVG